METSIDKLFDTLLKLPKSNLEQNKLDINVISPKNIEIIYVIMIKYFLEVEGGNINKIKNKTVYKGKKASSNGGIKFMISEIPDGLKSMISNFLKMVI